MNFCMTNIESPSSKFPFQANYVEFHFQPNFADFCSTKDKSNVEGISELMTSTITVRELKCYQK